jgi:hypothetical protein
MDILPISYSVSIPIVAVSKYLILFFTATLLLDTLTTISGDVVVFLQIQLFL